MNTEMKLDHTQFVILNVIMTLYSNWPTPIALSGKLE